MVETPGTLLEAARRVLTEHGKPMRSADIWQAIAARGLFTTTGKNPEAALATELLRATLGQRILGRRSDRFLYKAGPATYGLVDWLTSEERKLLEQEEATLDGMESPSSTSEAASLVALDPDRYQKGLEALRAALPLASQNRDFAQIRSAKDEVLGTYGSRFARERLPQLTAEEFRSFLIFKNNRHWMGLQRLGPAITRDMFALREALSVLFDESRPIDERVDYAHTRVSRLAQAVITPLLLVSAPNKYGVWNRISQAGLERFGLMPSLPPHATLGQRYAAINGVLGRLASDLQLDLWSLDALWWACNADGTSEQTSPEPEPPTKVPDRVWIEITEARHEHGGPGWELGTCLWSPTRNDAGAQSYELMREPKKGDLVIHFVLPVDSGQRRVAGMSTVALPLEERVDQPPMAGKWAGLDTYYRVGLDNHRPFTAPPSIDTLIQRNRDLLRQEAEDVQDYPFSTYGESVRLAQERYLARCTPALYDAIIDLLRERTDTTITPAADLRLISRDFAAALREAHLHFGPRHDELARTLLCSLAAKRFVILTGLSGSGKTQLALKLGEWLGGAGRCDLIPVRPDWTGPEALLGYEDALQPPSEDGRRTWCVPRTLELILRAARDPANPYLLILDEMNLAHVERYFADVLSGLESEQPIFPDLRDEDGRWRPSRRGMKLSFPENLLVIGTVNVDETTYLFSPKVLDRANTLEFRVDTEDLPLDAAAVRKPMPARAGAPELVAGFLEIVTDDEWQLNNAPDFIDHYVEALRTLHTALRTTGDEFGHRTFFEGLRLASLLAQAGDVDLDAALDVFVLQKILPRLHGSRRRLEPVLKAVASFCTASTGDAAQDPLTMPQSNARLPRSLAKTQRMFAALRANQFASFSD